MKASFRPLTMHRPISHQTLSAKITASDLLPTAAKVVSSFIAKISRLSRDSVKSVVKASRFTQGRLFFYPSYCLACCHANSNMDFNMLNISELSIKKT